MLSRSSLNTMQKAVWDTSGKEVIAIFSCYIRKLQYFLQYFLAISLFKKCSMLIYKAQDSEHLGITMPL